MKRASAQSPCLRAVLCSIGSESGCRRRRVESPRWLALPSCIRIEKIVFHEDLHHLTSDDAHAELGKVISGEKLGRRSAEKITIFDSRGTGIPVVAAAAHAYELACERGTRPDIGMM